MEAITQIEDKIDLTEIDQMVRKIGKQSENVIAILQAVQDRYNYLPHDALQYICDISDITPSTITGVATFYSQFRLKPAGRHFIKVCIGTACHVMGAETIYEAFKNHLKIPEQEDTDSKRFFTVEKVACLGCCMLAPAVQIDDTTFGFVTPHSVPQVLQNFSASLQNGATKHLPSKKKIKRDAGEIKICLCSSCLASGAQNVVNAIQQEIHDFQLPITVRTVGCTGMAYQAPLLFITTKAGNDFIYGNVKQEQVPKILSQHFRPTTIVNKWRSRVINTLGDWYADANGNGLNHYNSNGKHSKNPFVEKQIQMATQHAGQMTPLDLKAYKKEGGFKALQQCISDKDPNNIVETIKKSGLRGRGGAGFPTGQKWETVSKAKQSTKYIICNGDEGDPGAFMDRMILESFPYRVIEGILIAAIAVGAKQGYVYVRSEYPLAKDRIERAIQNCYQKNILGDNILNSSLSFHLSVVAGAGAFVCGEETALIAAIQGQRGMPRLRPPYPALCGFKGKPTLVNNVETFSLVPYIICQGSKKFASFGTNKSKGTKTFALAGKIRRSGLIEVPMGTSMRQIVEEIGGGIPGDKKLKAIQVGGPSGGCIPAHLADTPVDYESLTEVGAMMGSGGMVVLDETDCMVDIARYFMEFTQSESCGKCTMCRIGTKRMLEILERLCNGQGRKGDIEQLEYFAENIQRGSLCGLGKTAPNPVISTLTYFREEYQSHVEGHCPAGKCKAMISYQITDDCIGCTRCAQRCATEAIAFKPYQKHEIDNKLCTRCGTCMDVCPVQAVQIIT